MFPRLSQRAYLAHAAISPASTWVEAAVGFGVRALAAQGMGAFPMLEQERRRLRRNLGELIGARAEDLALMPNTTAGVTAIALSKQWKRGQRIVLFDGEFPANVTPWQRAAEVHGLQLEFVSLRPFPTDVARMLSDLRALFEQGSVALVAVSAVEFQTGLLMPLQELSELCRSYGAELFVDAVQGLGVVPFAQLASQADYVCAGSHKWLMGMEGAGFLYVAPRVADALGSQLAGWLSHQDGERFLFEGAGLLRYDRALVGGVRQFEAGTQDVLSTLALAGALACLQSLGIDAIAGHVQGYIDSLESSLVELGFASLRSPRPEQRSGNLCLLAPQGVDAPQLRKALVASGVACSVPDGVLRFAPHWPNPLEEVAFVSAAVRTAMAEQRV